MCSVRSAEGIVAIHGGEDVNGAHPPARLQAQDVGLEITTAAIDWLADKGFQPEYGARPLRRTIQRELDNRLSRMLLAADLAPGQTVKVDAAEGHLTFAVESPAPAPAA